MKFRKLTAVLLTMVLFVSLLAINAFAAVNETLGAPVVSGSYDEATGDITLTWEPVECAASYKIHGCLLEEIEWNLQDLGETTETSFVYTEGVPGNTYCFVVNAWDAEGNVSPENSNDVIVECTIPEPDPIAAPVVKASNDTETGKIKLNWNAVEGAVKYQVYRSTSKNGSYSLMFTTEGTSYTNSNAQVGTRYYYKVKAIAAEGGKNSEFSAIVSRTADLARPEVSITNVASSGKIKLTWNKIDGASGYEVYRSTKRSSGYTLLKTVSGTSFRNTSAVVGKTYYYKVKVLAEDASIDPKLSDIVSCTCTLPRTTVTAGNVASTGKVRLSWESVDGAVKYQVYRATNKNGEYKLMYTTSGTTYTNTSSKSGKTYYYKVKALASKSTADSALSTPVTRTADYAQPIIDIEKHTTSSIKISWPAVDGATSYQVYRSTKKTGTYKLLKTVKGTSLNNTSVTPGKTYYYKVRALGPVSAATSAYSVVISGKTVPEATTIDSTAYATSDSIKISWDKINGASGYYVYRRSYSSTNWKLVKTVTSGSTTSYKDKDAASKYYYKVAAYVTVDGTKHIGDYSDEVVARTLSKRSLAVKSNKSAFQNTISWNSIKGATAYKLYYKISKNGTWILIDTFDAETLSYVQDVQHGKNYYYRLRALHEEAGTTTYGEYGSTTYRTIIAYDPVIATSMSKKTDKSASQTVISVTNNGPCSITFYAEDAMWLDPDKTANCRKVTLYDYDEYVNSGKLVAIDSIKIKSGKSANLLIGVKGSDTRYDSDVAIYLLAYSDGVTYETYTSSDAGFMYYKK